MTNPVDWTIEALFPGWALSRRRARSVLAYYEAARPDRQRKSRRAKGSGDTDVARAGTALREQARHLEQNHDLARGVLGVLVQNVVGPHGITVEPQPRRADGTIHVDFAKQILEAWRDFAHRPEVTWSHDLPSMQRLAGRSWLRDGEVLGQHLVGPIASLNHGTRVPYSVELLEADMLPMDYSDPSKRIIMGVERNGWGRPIAYHLHRSHPGEALSYSDLVGLKRVGAERVMHLKLIDRIRQTRGVSIFAAILGRLDDIKDYEESERVAAKVAASMAAFIIKGSPEEYDPATALDDAGDPIRREMKFRPGMVFDDLRLGEQIGSVDPKRPNPQLETFRRGQLRAVASGAGGVAYSSIAKDYDGSYSAQRQELVESYGAYGVLGAEFINGLVRPVYEQFLNAATLAGVISVPADVVATSLDDALYFGPQMPWIDPLKEASAFEKLEANTHMSGPQIIRRRGDNPNDVLEQEAAWRQKKRDAGLDAAGGDPVTLDEDNDDAQNARQRPTRGRSIA
jgi:lambda family phage portal protein